MTKSNEACNHGDVVSDSNLKDSEVIKCQFESTLSKHLCSWYFISKAVV